MSEWLPVTRSMRTQF